MSRISFYLKDLGEKLTLFEEYNKSLDSDPELMASFFELLVELVLDSAAAIKHFRKNDIQVAITMATWNKIDQKFCQTLQELANKIDHLKKIIEARQLTKLTLSQTELIQALNRYNTNGPPLGSSDMSLPYYQLPFGRNPAFFGRSSVLRDIQSTLEAVDTARSIRSVAIWGTGGIGKSQVALEYANLQLTQGKCKLILWLPSETDTELSEALVDAATKVRPPGFVEGSSPEQIKFAMWNWLQTTGTPTSCDW